MGIVALVLAICLIALIDGSASAIIASFFVIGGCFIHLIPIKDKESIQYGLKLCFIVSFVYLICALIFSSSFSPTSFFLTSDPMRYLSSVLGGYSLKIDLESLEACYFQFADNNALYNELLTIISAVGNRYLGGSTVLSLTLFHSIFGVMTCSVVYRILLIKFAPKVSFRIALLYGLCTQVLFYSCVVLRDILIVYFFSRAFEIILKKHRFYDILVLFLMLLIVWGIRFYSGLFFGIFIMTYAFVLSYKLKLRYLVTPIFIVLTVAIVYFIFNSTSLVQQSLEELNEYAAFTSEAEAASGGLIYRLYTLPRGLQEATILLYSQMSPFPSYLVFREASSFSNYVMALDIVLYEFIWFFVFYYMLLSIVFKKGLRYLSIEETVLLLVALLFMIANTAHPDIRRMMPVYPIILYISYRIRSSLNNTQWDKLSRQLLVFTWIALLSLYIVIK